MIRVVTVWGQQIELTVHQESKSVWVASGQYLGEHKIAQDRSPAAAAKRWQEWASYKGNG